MNNSISLPSGSEQRLITPNQLRTAYPLSSSAISHARLAIRNILKGYDKRLLVIVGPCSIHDTDAALEYAKRLKSAAEKYSDDLYLVMRVYFEKPRTTVGWKGLISDPHLDGSFDVNHGLTLARNLLLQLNQLGVPAATEFLDTIIPAYLSDLISWSAIGARTVESQTHRELASHLAMPVGFKNNMDGNIKVAIDAVKVAQHSHPYLGITATGSLAIIRTTGNFDCHVILRGSNTAPNYRLQSLQETADLLNEAQLPARMMIDCSHGNSMKDYKLQHTVVAALIDQMKRGSSLLNGVMLESNLIAGKQALSKKEALVYGQSITDGCIGWDDTLQLLEKLALAVRVSNKIL